MGATAAPLLEMRDITKHFGNVTALSGVNLAVRHGEIHAICGENGAGKSTLMKVLSGIYPHGSYQGEIIFDGEPGEFKDIRSSERRGIGIIHQELALVPVLSIAENIFLGNEHASGGIISWHETTRHAQQLLARVGLRESPQTKISDIGVGKQQLVEIAKALSKKVKLLILDEPTAALNDEDSRHLLDLIVELAGQGLTCIIISHKLNEVMRVLTVFSTVMLPLTFITGLYGMNFEYMPYLHFQFGFELAIGVMLLVAATMFFFFRRRRWI